MFIFFNFLWSGIIIPALIFLFFLSSSSLNPSMYKYSTPSEGGFSSYNSLMGKMSLHFLFFLILFIIFDAEIVLLLPAVTVYKSLFLFIVLFIFFTFILEWGWGKATWTG